MSFGIGVKFVNKDSNHSLSSKINYYKIEKDLLLSALNNGLGSNYFLITNGNGYDYRKSPISVVELFAEEDAPEKFSLATSSISTMEVYKDFKPGIVDTTYRDKQFVDWYCYQYYYYTIHPTRDLVSPNRNLINFENENKPTVEKKEKKNMFQNLMKNFEFGKYTHDNVKMSIYGIAVRNKNGSFCTYADGKGVTDVTDMLIDISGMLYVMPVAIKDIKAGDVIIHGGRPVIVTHDNETNDRIQAIDLYESEEKVILPQKNIFGFDFVSKIVNLCEGMFGSTSENFGTSETSPFGSMLPLMMLGDNNGFDMKTLMMMNMFSNGSIGAPASNDMMGIFSNPMMMMMLLNDDGGTMEKILPLVMMQNMNFGSTKAKSAE